MDATTLETLLATIPQYAVMIWVIVRLEGIVTRLTDALIANNRLLLDMHPPQSEKAAFLLAQNAAKNPPDGGS